MDSHPYLLSSSSGSTRGAMSLPETAQMNCDTTT